jgi:hypothetical protein
MDLSSPAALGYRAVEVSCERGSGGSPPVPNGTAGRDNHSPRVPRLRSPLGYRAELVAEERGPSRPARPKPAKLVSKKQSATSSFTRVWGCITLGCLVLFGVAIFSTIAISQSRTSTNVRSNRQVGITTTTPRRSESVSQQVAHRDFGIHIPDADLQEDKDSADGPVMLAQAACDPGAVCDKPIDHETFGTTVQFVRNPEEAARVAAAEHKLTFLLHVSGNFEENRFT